MAFIGLRVSDQLAARFEAVAATRGGKSKLLRAMIEAVTKAPPGEGEGSGAARGASQKVTLRLKPDDLAALDAAARQAGLRRTEWLVACARRRLKAKPQFNREEAISLLEARRELRRIGVNLRELARRLAEKEAAAAEDLAAIQTFQADVRRQIEGLRSAIDGNLAYWSGEA
jgi:hypothetical protein